VTSIIVAVLAGGLRGVGLDRLRWNPVIASSIAAMTGWLIGSLVAAAAWLMWPPRAVDVLAVSVGLFEVAIAAGLTMVLGLLIHFGMDAFAGDTPRLLAYRPALISVVGALVGVLGFAFGEALKPVL